MGSYSLLQGIFPDPGIEEPGFPALQADSLPYEPQESPLSFTRDCKHIVLHNKHNKTMKVYFTGEGTPGFPYSSVGKEPTCNAGDPGSIPGWGRSAGEGIGYTLQYSWAALVAQLVKNSLFSC